MYLACLKNGIKKWSEKLLNTLQNQSWLGQNKKTLVFYIYHSSVPTYTLLHAIYSRFKQSGKTNGFK